MPIRKKNVSRRKRTVKKKTAYRRRKYNSNKLSTVSSKLSPVPDRFYTRMRYSEVLDITTSSVAFIASSYFFRGTSIFDPDLTATGHQPMGHDELAQLYRRYQVHSVSYKFTLRPTLSTSIVYLVVENKDDTDTSTDYKLYMERAHSQKVAITGSQSGTRYATIKGKHIPNVAEGVTKEQYRTDVNYRALMGANPNANSYIALVYWASAPSIQVFIDVELTYNVMLYEAVELNIS